MAHETLPGAIPAIAGIITGSPPPDGLAYPVAGVVGPLMLERASWWLLPARLSGLRGGEQAGSPRGRACRARRSAGPGLPAARSPRAPRRAETWRDAEGMPLAASRGRARRAAPGGLARVRCWQAGADQWPGRWRLFPGRCLLAALRDAAARMLACVGPPVLLMEVDVWAGWIHRREFIP
jgi:hypothetical protein